MAFFFNIEVDQEVSSSKQIHYPLEHTDLYCQLFYFYHLNLCYYCKQYQPDEIAVAFLS
jgi:hypothetical protein